MQVPSHIKRLDNFLSVASKLVNFSFVTPTNVDSQRRSFVKHGRNPHFNYKTDAKHAEAIKDVLTFVSLGNSPLEKLYIKKIKEVSLKAKLVSAVGTDAFPKLSEQLFAPPDDELISIAKRILKIAPTKSTGKLKRAEAIGLLKSAFKHMHLDWSIKGADIITSALVEPSKRQLQLRKRERYAKNYLQRLIVHEIGVHGVRYENAQSYQLALFQQGTANYLETEEGLAVYAEAKAGLLTASMLRNYAGRVLAIDFARRYSFVETYKRMTKYFSDAAAWKLTVRAKRGLAHTSDPGAFTKDVVYLRGFLRVMKYAEKNDVNELLVGKIALEDMSQLRKAKLLHPVKLTLEDVRALPEVTPCAQALCWEEIVSLVQK